MEFVLELLLEFGAELLVQILAEIGTAVAARPFRRSGRPRPVLAAFGLVLLGGLTGPGCTLLLPNRLVPNPVLPGPSLLVSPLLLGGAMAGLGRWRRLRGGQPSVLASLWGGALFAFSFALVRWLMLRS